MYYNQIYNQSLENFQPSMLPITPNASNLISGCLLLTALFCLFLEVVRYANMTMNECILLRIITLFGTLTLLTIPCEAILDNNFIRFL